MNRKISVGVIVLFIAVFCMAFPVSAQSRSMTISNLLGGPGRHHVIMDDVYFFTPGADIHHGVFRQGPWGRLQYNLWGDSVSLALIANGLDRRTGYTLIYPYVDDAGNQHIVCLGSARTNRRGYLHLRARLDICSLPAYDDAHYEYGALLQLVPSQDVDCENGMLSEENNAEYLISYHPIRFTDTDGCSSMPESQEPPPSETDQEPIEPTEPEPEPEPIGDNAGSMPY
jgi:hypothetical protein